MQVQTLRIVNIVGYAVAFILPKKEETDSNQDGEWWVTEEVAGKTVVRGQ